jgi:methylenetetrahydrofolate dehydrogenase (NADP+) / methenyltetrahydrofolate cyclohydrolase
MTATLLDGKELARTVREGLKEKIVELEKKPHLAVILVGDDPMSHVYVGTKEKACKEVGIESTTHRLPSSASQEEVLSLVETLNQDEVVDGILLQLPLPSPMDKDVVLAAIDPKKDVDGLTPHNLGKLVQGEEGLIPCTPKGIMALLEKYSISLEGKHVVIINRSVLVGKPLAQLFLNKHATVTLCHSKTKNLEEHTKRADVLVSAIGKPGVVEEGMVKERAVVVDVGISKVDGVLVGDVSSSVSEKASYITPVPGGVGPMTVAMLLENMYLVATQ